jgi:single-strand DNA-binding protein
MYLNKVFIIGNLTRDPEIKSLPAGTRVATFSLATNRTWKDAQGAKKESVEYHNIVAFARAADLIGQYCKKGSSLYIEGRLQTRSWDAPDGSKKYRTEIILENFQFGPKGTIGSTSPAPERQSDAEAPQKDSAPDLDTIEYPDEEINLEDIPF